MNKKTSQNSFLEELKRQSDPFKNFREQLIFRNDIYKSIYGSSSLSDIAARQKQLASIGSALRSLQPIDNGSSVVLSSFSDIAAKQKQLASIGSALRSLQPIDNGSSVVLSSFSDIVAKQKRFFPLISALRSLQPIDNRSSVVSSSLDDIAVWRKQLAPMGSVLRSLQSDYVGPGFLAAFNKVISGRLRQSEISSVEPIFSTIALSYPTMLPRSKDLQRLNDLFDKVNKATKLRLPGTPSKYSAEIGREMEEQIKYASIQSYEPSNTPVDVFTDILSPFSEIYEHDNEKGMLEFDTYAEEFHVKYLLQQYHQLIKFIVINTIKMLCCDVPAATALLHQSMPLLHESLSFISKNDQIDGAMKMVEVINLVLIIVRYLKK